MTAGSDKWHAQRSSSCNACSRAAQPQRVSQRDPSTRALSFEISLKHTKQLLRACSGRGWSGLIHGDVLPTMKVFHWLDDSSVSLRVKGSAGASGATVYARLPANCRLWRWQRSE